MDERNLGGSLGYSRHPGAMRGFYDENGRPLRRHRNGVATCVSQLAWPKCPLATLLAIDDLLLGL